MTKLQNDSSPASIRSIIDAIAKSIFFLSHIFSLIPWELCLLNTVLSWLHLHQVLKQLGGITIDTREAHYFSLGTKKICAAKRTISRLSFF